MTVSTWGRRWLRARVTRWSEASPSVGRVLPAEPESPTLYVPPADADPEAGPRDRPLPPAAEWELEESTDPERYLASGESDVERMRQVLSDHGSALRPGARILDFGCGYGRMIRWLDDEARTGAVWGTDVDAGRVNWCRQHLTPPFDFVTCTTFPFLPFEDGSFDLVYAGSVVPHLGDLADAWLLELRRVLAPGGDLYLTIYDAHSAEVLLRERPSSSLGSALRSVDERTGFAAAGFDVLAVNRQPGRAQVFFDRGFIDRVWGRWFEVEAVVQDARDVQSAVLLSKRDRPISTVDQA
ncbi:MAG TPA: class I SAM-dependent methyltransferase [Acidimicrobiales bacterium]|nr:class I SAM-dependent methyltransferase [Acidimicrobiales bacterium]